MASYSRTGLDSRSLAGVAVFGTLAVVLTSISQALGLNFPVIPYLQFDLGEIAILLAFFIFGPIPALAAAFIEFATLMAIGVNVAFFGPELKLIAILSSLLGLWIGLVVVRRLKRPTVGKAIGLGAGLGMAIRAIAMTLPNYLIIIYLYGLSGIIGYVSGGFKDVGISLSDSNSAPAHTGDDGSVQRPPVRLRLRRLLRDCESAAGPEHEGRRTEALDPDLPPEQGPEGHLTLVGGSWSSPPMSTRNCFITSSSLAEQVKDAAVG